MKANAQQAVSFKNPAGEMWKGLLADLNYGFPHPDPNKPASDGPRTSAFGRHLGKMVTITFDPNCVTRMEWNCFGHSAWFEFSSGSYHGPADMVKAFPDGTKTIFGEIPDEKNERRWIVRSILHWLLRLQPPTDCVAFALGAAESALALVPKETLHLTEADAAKLEELTRSHAALSPYDWQRVQDRMLVLQAKTRWRSQGIAFWSVVQGGWRFLSLTPPALDQRDARQALATNALVGRAGAAS